MPWSVLLKKKKIISVSKSLKSTAPEIPVHIIRVSKISLKMQKCFENTHACINCYVKHLEDNVKSCVLRGRRGELIQNGSKNT